MERNDTAIDEELLAAAIKVRDASRDPKNQTCIALMGEVIEILKKKDEGTLNQILAECTSKQADPDDEYVVISNAAMGLAPQPT